MKATGLVGFTGHTEKSFSAPQKGRQLQLVLGAEAASPQPPAHEGGNPKPSISSSGCIVESLAEYALGLRVGDPCFCCGGALSAAHPGGGGDAGEGEGAGAPPLECSECGASVAGPG